MLLTILEMEKLYNPLALVSRKLCFFLIFIITAFSVAGPVSAQLRRINNLHDNPANDILKLSFYSASEGYMATENWVGYTKDSGRTFIQRPVTNVDLSGFGRVNLTFGFNINGVKALNKDTILVYGDYGWVPAILRSTDGGNNYKLVFHSLYDPLKLVAEGLTYVEFPENNNVGYGIDADRIIKTVDWGLTWTVVRVDPQSYFDHLEAVDNNQVLAIGNSNINNKLVRTTNGGSSWQTLAMPVLPGGKMLYAHFLNSTVGWMSMYDSNNKKYFFKTNNGGGSWVQQNNTEATPFKASHIKFFDENTGYAIDDYSTLFKTFNSGVTWEPLRSDNQFPYYHNDLQCISSNQLWTGGARGFLEITTNGGGTPIPTGFFRIDTTDILQKDTVRLVNYSRPGYTFQWFLNNELISTSYHTSYFHNLDKLRDTIKLVVSNGVETDSTIKIQEFYPPVIITSFSPTFGGIGTRVTINGPQFKDLRSVSFGGVNATDLSQSVYTSIVATVGNGATGDVKVITATSKGSLPGFVFFPLPVITSFTPISATAGTTITLTGENFGTASSLTIGGVPATFNVLSATTITAVAPSASSGDIVVITKGGKATATGFIAIPVITSFTPDRGTHGTIMSITGTSFSDITAITIGAVPVSSFTINSSTNITAIVGPGATGNLKVSKPGAEASLAAFTWFPPPVITSFTPAAGPAGTTVTITGTGFHATPENNMVFFGAVRAVVTGGTTTSLTVTVPAGATFEPIRVNSNNLLGSSAKPFLVTFSDGGSITPNSFTEASKITTSGYTPTHISISDLDGDGKTDLIVSKSTSIVANQGMHLYRNTSSGTAITYASPVYLSTGYIESAVGDLDGDGKTDLVVISDEVLDIFKNNSQPGVISFARVSSPSTPLIPRQVSIADIDGDGKLDIITNSGFSNSTTLYRNISEPGSIKFMAGLKIYGYAGDRNIIYTDLDGDAKPDLVFAAGIILRNKSTTGNIQFDAPILAPGFTHSYLASGDIDGDGKTDLVSGDLYGSRVVVFPNNSSPGNISFLPEMEYHATSRPEGIQVADLDGDGKLDIATALENFKLGVLKNISTPSDVSFLPNQGYTSGNFSGTQQLQIADLNGDGKNDVVIISSKDNSITTFANKVSPEPVIHSFSPTVGTAGTAVTITGSNFTGVNAVTIGGVAVSSFTVNSSNSITALLSSGGSGPVAVSNNFGRGVRAGFVFGRPPSITGISPANGAIGSTVEITGNNYSANLTDNIVYFGGVKAIVSYASPTLLRAVVPVGTTYDPVTVTVNNLTAHSMQPFNVTFPGADSTFLAGSFALPIDRPNGGRGTLSDLDGDGRLDLVMGNPYTGNTSMFIARNISTSGNISFSPNVTYTLSEAPSIPNTGDLDGDGKPDVVMFGTSSVAVLRNISSTGAISLSAPVRFPVGNLNDGVVNIVIHDLDGDGKPEIVAANYGGVISVLKNESVTGNILFAPRIDYKAEGYISDIKVKDMDGDGKPDMVVSATGIEGSSVYINKSLIGTIVFERRINFAPIQQPYTMAVGDMDNDGKPDVILGKYDSSALAVFNNQSVPGNVIFGSKKELKINSNMYRLSIGDLDGDGKPDLVNADTYPASIVSLIKNSSSPGNISLRSAFRYSLKSDAYHSSIGDIDGDGLPDIVVYLRDGTTSILRNILGQSVTVQACAKRDTSFSAGITGSSYQWQQNTGAGFLNLTDNSNFTGTTSSTLQLKNMAFTMNNAEFRCLADATKTSKIFKLSLADAVTPSVSISTPKTSVCVGDNVVFTAQPRNEGTAPVYLWNKNGTPVGSGSSTFTAGNLVNSDVVSLRMTSNAACASPLTVTSNNITMNVSVLVPQISISGTTTVTEGNEATIIYTNVTNGGNIPAYKWEDSTREHSWQPTGDPSHSSIVYRPVVTGTRLRCIVTSNASCAAPASVTSNVLTFTVNKITGIIPVTAVEHGVKYYPNPAGSVLVIDSLHPADKFEYLEIKSINGGQKLMSVRITGKAKVVVPVDALKPGLYIAILYRKEDQPLYFKFIKQ